MLQEHLRCQKELVGMDSVDSNSAVSIARMFEELIRDHHAAGPLSSADGARPARVVRPPRPPRRASRSFWEMSSEEARVAELSILLAPPDVRAPAFGCAHVCSFEPGQPVVEAARPGAGSSIAPVAMSAEDAFVRDIRHSLVAGQRLRWLLPASAAAFALGAVVATGWGHLHTERANDHAVRHAGHVKPPRDFTPQTLAAPMPDSLSMVELAAREPDRASVVDVSDWPDPEPAALSQECRRAAEEISRLLRSAANRASSQVARRAVPAPSPTASLGAPRPLPQRRHNSSPEPTLSTETTDTPFDKGAARSALHQAAGLATACVEPGQGTHLVPVAVTFAPSGRVTVAQVGGTLAGTAAGSCVARAFRGIQIPAFTGPHVTVSKTVRIK